MSTDFRFYRACRGLCNEGTFRSVSRLLDRSVLRNTHKLQKGGHTFSPLLVHRMLLCLMA